MVNTTNHSTPRRIPKTLAMANNSDPWDADSILTKLLALQLSSEPEQSMSHEWDGDDVSARLQALLQATQSDHGRPPPNANPNLDQGNADNEPPDVALSRMSLRGQDPPLPLTATERSPSPPSRMSPSPIDHSYQLTPASPLSNDDEELPEVNMSSMGEFN